MSKAVVILTSVSWDSTNGFSGVVSYALSGAGSFNTTSFTASLGLSTAINQNDSFREGIRTAVIANVLSNFSTTLTLDDVILLF